MRKLAASVSVVTLLVGATACSSKHHDLTRAEARRATTAGTADAATLLGPSWKPVTSPRIADELIADRCGDPRKGLGVPRAGLMGSAMSPMLSGDPDVGSNPTKDGHVRTAVVAYKDAAGATAAFGALGFAAFEQCLVAAVTTYVHGDHPDREPVPDPTSGSFKLTSPAVSAGDAATMYEATFDEGILGGFDNTHNTDLFVARSDSIVVTALAASSSQLGAAARTRALARRLGVSALAASKGK